MKNIEVTDDTFKKLLLIADHFTKRIDLQSDNDRAEGAINNMMGFVSVYSDGLKKIVYNLPGDEVEFILDGGEIREV